MTRPLRCLLTAAGVATLMACAAPPPAAPVATAAPAEAEITADRIAAHVRMLSHDHFEGRAPATRGGELATAYLATQLHLFKAKTRGGGPFHPLMIRAAAELEDADIEALSTYFASR